MAASFDYNALRDDHPRLRWRRFWFFLLDLSLLVLGAYFLYRYATAWRGHSTLFWWWLLPAVLCLLLGSWALLGIWRRGRAPHRHAERYVRLDSEHISWWLDLHETPQRVALQEVERVSYSVRDINLHLENGQKQVLHTYLILAPHKEEELREALRESFPETA